MVEPPAEPGAGGGCWLMTDRWNTARCLRTLLLAAAVVSLLPARAEAYIGPGAGFAVLSSFFVVFLAMFSALLALMTWPVRRVIRAIRGRRALSRARIKRCVVLGLDGMSPELADKYLARGMLPNLAKLRDKGTYTRLGTTSPPLSPVAWSTFLTGSNPGKHNIFDFLTVDRRTYHPKLSSVRIGGPRRVLKLGKYRIPIGKPDIRLLRKRKPFWNTLGEHGIFSGIIRVPITFPPEKFNGVLLSAMCVPDLRGSQGTFSFYTTRAAGDGEYTGGEQMRVTCRGGRIESYLVGPENSLVDGAGACRCPFSVVVDQANESATLTVDGQTVQLKRGVYTDWVRVTFRLGLGVKVRGICQFQLGAVRPEFELYVTPIQMDPANPAMPIATPTVYSVYLAKSQGAFATLGLAEDTWALNEEFLDDEGFLHQCMEADREREVMFMDTLEKVKRGLCVVVFDGTDRVQHMFWRYIDPDHPAREGFGERRRRDAIEEHYRRCDELVGRVMAKCDDDDTVLMVLSDHGFNSFRRGIDLNRWLIDEGYMVLKADAKGEKYLKDVDWSQTRAFGLGLAGIFLNIKDRYSQGIVDRGAEAGRLREELCAKLTGLRDAERGELAISEAYNAMKIYTGPYKTDAPDIIVGYNIGYRVSWEAAIGEVTEKVFHDNTKAWSGDHCIDPKLVPGVLFCNRKIETESIRLMDVGPTVLDLFGVGIPKHMDGKPFAVAAANGNSVESRKPKHG